MKFYKGLNPKTEMSDMKEFLTGPLSFTEWDMKNTLRAQTQNFAR